MHNSRQHYRQLLVAFMLSVTITHQVQAGDQVQAASVISDPEAFFMFLADSIEDQGQLFTPIDIEELKAEEASSLKSLGNEINQEETIQ